MHLLIDTVDIYLFTFTSIVYNVVNLISSNSIIYGFIISQVKHTAATQSKNTDSFYSIGIFIIIYILNNFILLKIVSNLYNKHMEYIKQKTSKKVSDLYLTSLLRKYIYNIDIENIYKLFFRFNININNYWKSYELHGQIIVALGMIYWITKNLELTGKLSLISTIVVSLVAVIEYFSPDVFNELGEYVFTSIMNEKLMLLFLIYMPYIVIKTTENHKSISLILSVFIALFWKVSFKNFINGYVKKLELIQLIKQTKFEISLPELNYKNDIYIIADIREPVDLMTYFRMIKIDVTEDEVVDCLNSFSLLPEIGNTLNIQLDDNTIQFETKIKISIARSLLLEEHYRVAYYSCELISKYEHLIRHEKILLDKLAIKI